jgi:hypothetical protein
MCVCTNTEVPGREGNPLDFGIGSLGFSWNACLLNVSHKERHYDENRLRRSWYNSKSWMTCAGLANNDSRKARSTLEFEQAQLSFITGIVSRELSFWTPRIAVT